MSSIAPPSVKATADNRFVPFFRAGTILLSADGAVGLLTVVIEPPLPLPLCSPGGLAGPLPLQLYSGALVSPYHGKRAARSAVVSWQQTVQYVCKTGHPNTASPATLLSCRRHTTASLEPAQITTAVMRTVNTSHIIMQYMQNQNLQKQVRRRWQCGDKSDEDMDTDFSQSTSPGNMAILVAMGQAHAVERRFWTRETSTDWWDRIVLQVWDDSQWLRNFRMRKGTFMELCDLLSPALKRKNTKMRAALTVHEW
ncbi:hypothetical protein UY3_10904 [Chelonia mydas]|uniref:Uncharacterized protein n=1 Tax=Chelonia mydas TaxID=8469 RepID=M7B8W2_CHEMY|nr:hypothetical protein UY3_10904 [Chelonia mydas]